MKPEGRNDGHNMDYTKLTDNIFIGSNLCKGNVCPIHADEFKKLGVCVELNLSAEKKEVPPDMVNGYMWIPVVDGYAPSPDQLDLGTAIVNECIKNNNVVYVHCKNGHGRSPTMVAAYFIRFENNTVHEEINFIKTKRCEVHFEKRQIDALGKFYDKCQK